MIEAKNMRLLIGRLSGKLELTTKANIQKELRIVDSSQLIDDSGRVATIFLNLSGKSVIKNLAKSGTTYNFESPQI